MRRPMLLSLRVVVVGVHGITRIHGGQKQKDIKSDPISDHTINTDAYLLYVLPPYSVYRGATDSHPTNITS
jgi:hypothetical protein